MELQSVNVAKTKSPAIAPVTSVTDPSSAAAAFAALMRTAGFKFSGETGLAHVEGQFIRVKPMKDSAPEPNVRDAVERPKPERVATDDAKAADDAPQARKSDNDDASADDSDTAAKAADTGAARPTDAAQDQVDAVAATIQFEVLVQLPTGETQQVAVVDLDTLLAVAEQNPEFAQALQQAINTALGVDAQGQAIEGAEGAEIDPALNLAAVTTTTDISAEGAEIDPALNLAAVTTTTDISADAGNDGRDRVANLFRNLIGALRPAAEKANANADQAASADQTADAAVEAKAQNTLDLRSAEAVRQSKELSSALGGEAKIEIKVVVDGQPAGRVGFQWSKYNPFAGYNPAEMRQDSLANGMTGTGLGEVAVEEVAAAMPEPRTATPWAGAAAGLAAIDPNANSSARTPSGPGAVRADGAPNQAIERPAATNPQQNQSSNNSFAGLMNQNAPSAVAKTQAPERPLPTTPQEVIEQIKVNITRAAKAGVDRVTIQLKPEDLGRIEVKLEMSQDGKVRATIAAENPATLELLKADARGMERALQDAGLRASADDLEFNLRGQDSERLADDRGRSPERDHGRGAGTNAANDDVVDEAPSFDYVRAARLRGGVDTYA